MDWAHNQVTCSRPGGIGTMLLSSQLYRDAGLAGLLRHNAAGPTASGSPFIASPRCPMPSPETVLN